MASISLSGRRLYSRLTPAEEEIIKVSFESFSEETDEIQKTEDGQPGGPVKRRYIMTHNLAAAFQDINREAYIHDIQLLINEIDENGDGKIDEMEWRRIMTKKFLGEDDDSSFQHVFSLLDDNKDGYIPAVELRSLLMREGQAPLSEQEVEELLVFADLDGDGLVDYRSFLRWLSAPELQAQEKRPA